MMFDVFLFIFFFSFPVFVETKWWKTAFPEIPVALPFVIDPIVKGGELVSPAVNLDSLSKIFFFCLKLLGGEDSDVESAFVINNPKLTLSLQTSIRLLEGKLSDTGSLFQRDDWKSGPGSEKVWEYSQ